MTIKDVHERVHYIKCIADDDEAAHAKEDDLHQDVLLEIANGAENASALAKAALLTRDLDFSRWCA